jgi:EAL domain-containing protein (putative c-di-GMP-specific phosphodiesterase class I)
VNVSFKQAQHRDLVAEFRRIIAESGFDPHHLALELTEDALLEDPLETAQWIKTLRTDGVQFWIDDFGTGYSSLASLAKLPLDALKIDRAFISELGCGSRADDLVRTIIALARNLHLQVVAEGVETPAQRDQLKAEGCDFGQGYLWSKPLPSDQIPALLQASFLPLRSL